MAVQGQRTLNLCTGQLHLSAGLLAGGCSGQLHPRPRCQGKSQGFYCYGWPSSSSGRTNGVTGSILRTGSTHLAYKTGTQDSSRRPLRATGRYASTVEGSACGVLGAIYRDCMCTNLVREKVLIYTLILMRCHTLPAHQWSCEWETGRSGLHESRF